MLTTVIRYDGVVEDPLGYLDRVHEGVLHARQLQAEVVQHGGDHGVQLPGEVVRRGQAAKIVDIPGILGIMSYRPLRGTAPHQRWAHHAKFLCPRTIQVLHFIFREMDRIGMKSPTLWNS